MSVLSVSKIRLVGACTGADSMFPKIKLSFTLCGMNINVFSLYFSSLKQIPWKVIHNDEGRMASA